MYIYTIGALTYYHRNNRMEEALKWRNDLGVWAKENNIKIFNPALTYLKEINHTYTPKMAVEQNDYYINKSDIILHVLNINEKRLGEKYDKLFESFLLKEYYLFNITHERKSELNFSEKINKTSKNQINEEIVDYEDYADVTRNNNYIDTLSIVDTFEVIEN